MRRADERRAQLLRRGPPIGIAVERRRECVPERKDVIESAGIGNIQRYVEKSTRVHELGDAIGLVNNGVLLTSAQTPTTAPTARTTAASCTGRTRASAA